MFPLTSNGPSPSRGPTARTPAPPPARRPRQRSASLCIDSCMGIGVVMASLQMHGGSDQTTNNSRKHTNRDPIPFTPLLPKTVRTRHGVVHCVSDRDPPRLPRGHEGVGPDDLFRVVIETPDGQVVTDRPRKNRNQATHVQGEGARWSWLQQTVWRYGSMNDRGLVPARASRHSGSRPVAPPPPARPPILHVYVIMKPIH